MTLIMDSFELGSNVVFEAHYSDISIFDLYPDDTEEQLKEMIQSLDNYESVLFDAKIYIKLGQIKLGIQWLNGCHYNEIEDFLKDNMLSEMIEQAQESAKEEIEALIPNLIALKDSL